MTADISPKKIKGGIIMADSNFLLFNEAHNETRTYNDSEYKNATQRQTGVVPGMALSRMHNKMYYQWSAMCKAIADGLVKAGYDCYDYDIEGISNNFKTWMDSAGLGTIDKHNTDPDAHQNLKTLIQNSGINILKRSHEYEVGDIAYSPLLKSYQRLECVVGGVTASTDIDVQTSTTGGGIN